MSRFGDWFKMANFRIIRTSEEFRTLEMRWNELFSGNDKHRFFQDFQWNFGIWTRLGRNDRDQLFIIHATRDGHEEELILPTYLDSQGVLRYIGEQYSDVLGPICLTHQGNWHTFFKDLIRFIEDQVQICDVRLVKMEADSEFLQFLSVYYKKHAAMIAPTNTYSYLSTRKGEDLSSAFSHLNSKERSYLRSLVKKYDDCSFLVLSKSRGDVYPVGKIQALRDWMVENGQRNMDALPDALIDLAGEFYDRGQCELAVYEKDNEFELVSYRLFDRRDGYINFWIVIYKDPQMPTAADVRYILETIPNGNHTYDFGTGAYSYKLGTFRPHVRQIYGFFTKRRTWGSLENDMKNILRFYVKPLIRRK